ncbi:MAG: hypothetical protein JW849_07975 [Phycisphaerae bacterium]|nr:hypothetical protein [Phycisphaerae bacterium]
MNFLVLIILALFGLGAIITFVYYFRTEGMLAFYLVGMHYIYAVVEYAGIPWTTLMTGLVRPILFLICAGAWLFGPARRETEEVSLPRTFSPAVFVILFLVFFWELKYFFEGQVEEATFKYEYYKWAYVINRWAAVFVLGVLFPLTLKRLRRFLLALGLLGLGLAGLLMVNYLMGTTNVAQFEARYTPLERGSNLGFGIYISMGGAALLGWMVMKNALKKSQKRTIFIYTCVAFMMLSTMLTGSRGPMASLFLTMVATIMIVGGRHAWRYALGMVGFGLVMFVGWNVVSPAARGRLFGAFFTEGGVGERVHLLLASFKMLEVAPVFGQTRGFVEVTGFGYSHQFTTEMMVEMGLFGLLLFLGACIPTVIQWAKWIWRRGHPLQFFAAPLMVWFTWEFIQRHVAGSLTSTDWWLVLGIMMGHRLEIKPQDNISGYSPPEEMIEPTWSSPAFGVDVDRTPMW